ncbi:DNA-binding transcriptional regulator [Legionella sp. km535]|uniref:helix-turn-helix domain-containing protein n=1 Tax=Legionella sp. km535 TaxID=2498107 RepID=UPI0018F67B71|nr:transcriptional regulator [Legionella sp. km535]
MKKSILDAVQGSARGLYDADIVDATTMHEFDALCLPPIKVFTSQEIKTLRLKEHVSQVVFAKYLNTSPSTIRYQPGLKCYQSNRLHNHIRGDTSGQDPT